MATGSWAGHARDTVRSHIWLFRTRSRRSFDRTGRRNDDVAIRCPDWLCRGGRGDSCLGNICCRDGVVGWLVGTARPGFKRDTCSFVRRPRQPIGGSLPATGDGMPGGPIGRPTCPASILFHPYSPSPFPPNAAAPLARNPSPAALSWRYANKRFGVGKLLPHSLVHPSPPCLLARMRSGLAPTGWGTRGSQPLGDSVSVDKSRLLPPRPILVAPCFRALRSGRL